MASTIHRRNKRLQRPLSPANGAQNSRLVPGQFTATGDQVLAEGIGPNPTPSLALLRHDLNTAGLNGLNVRVSLVPASYRTLPK